MKGIGNQACQWASFCNWIALNSNIAEISSFVTAPTPANEYKLFQAPDQTNTVIYFSLSSF